MAETDKTGEIDLNPAKAFERVDAWLDGFVRILPNLIIAILFIVIAWYVAKFIGRMVNRTATSRDRGNLGDVFGSFVRWSVFLFAALIALTIVVPSMSPGDLIAGLGVSSVAIGFAFKDILQNWLAGMLILLRQPFEIDDEIKIGDYEGTVERIESRATILKTYSGERVVIPNADIYTSSVVVRTAYANARNEYDIGVGYGDDLDEARAEILAAVNSVEGVETDPAAETLIWGLDASWVTIRARWWQASDRKSMVNIKSEVMRAVKAALDDKGIDMPFETQMHLWHDQTEESDGDRRRQREGWGVSKNSESDAPRSRRDADRETAQDAA
jgi:small-conductance mechanosensitive channel